MERIRYLWHIALYIMSETVLYLLGAGTVGSIITAVVEYFIKRKKENDTGLMDRVKFLEERIEKLEKLVCWDSDCKKRI